jgi:hypothetical protein
MNSRNGDEENIDRAMVKAFYHAAIAIGAKENGPPGQEAFIPLTLARYARYRVSF